MRCSALVFILELGVALPDGAAVLVGGIPDLGTEELAAVSAYDAGGEYAASAVASAIGLTTGEFLLNSVPFVRWDDGLMRMFDVVLRYLALVDFQLFLKKIRGEGFL